MAKFEDLQKSIYSVFDSVAWKAEGINTLPDNFAVSAPLQEFIRLDILAGGKGANPMSVSGLLIIDIFITAGIGTSRANSIADILDKHLQRQTINSNSGSTQTFDSSFVSKGADKENPSLARFQLSLPFIFSGKQP